MVGRLEAGRLKGSALSAWPARSPGKRGFINNCSLVRLLAGQNVTRGAPALERLK